MFVNHSEDPTTVDFGDYVSLAEKEDADMARRGEIWHGAGAAEWIEQKLSLDNENEGTSMLGRGGPTTTREEAEDARFLLEAREVVESHGHHDDWQGYGRDWAADGRISERRILPGSRGRLEHARGQGEEMMLAAPDKGREDAIVGQRKREAGTTGHRRNSGEGWGSNDAKEIGVDLVLVLVQLGNSRFR
ncbi:hypothetical protein BHM03_00052538 [Ensete ventricosum]|nr:hypothetical protein BHM03_00052538 [Ensete ventricosum]